MINFRKKIVLIPIVVVLAIIGLGMSRFGPTFEAMPLSFFCTKNIGGGNFTAPYSEDFQDLRDGLEKNDYILISDWGTGGILDSETELSWSASFEKKSKKLWGREVNTLLTIGNSQEHSISAAKVSVHDAFRLEFNGIMRDLEELFSDNGWVNAEFDRVLYIRECNY